MGTDGAWDEEAVLRLRAVIARLARQLNASATGEGLTPTQASVLGLVVAYGPLSLAELTALEGLNPTMLSRVVGKLDQMGLIRRIPDPADLRSASVESTAAGQRVNRTVKAKRAAAIRVCIDRLSPEDEVGLLAALPALESLSGALRDGGARAG